MNRLYFSRRPYTHTWDRKNRPTPPPLCHLSYVPITGSLRQRGREALGRRLNTRQKIPALWNAVSKLTQYEDFRYVTRVRMTSSDPDSLSLSLQFFFTLPDSMAACGKAAREWAFGHCFNTDLFHFAQMLPRTSILPLKSAAYEESRQQVHTIVQQGSADQFNNKHNKRKNHTNPYEKVLR